MIEFLWLLAGLLGCVIIWRLDKRGDETWCPTPLAILGATFGSVLGPIMLAAAIVIYFIDLANKGDNWFTRPICKRKDTT